jgi:hypothetical protein
MFFIRKYANCWAIHDDDTGASRPLSLKEIINLAREFPALADEDLRTVFTDTILSIDVNLPPGPKRSWKDQTYFN